MLQAHHPSCCYGCIHPFVLSRTCLRYHYTCMHGFSIDLFFVVWVDYNCCFLLSRPLAITSSCYHVLLLYMIASLFILLRRFHDTCWYVNAFVVIFSFSYVDFMILYTSICVYYTYKSYLGDCVAMALHRTWLVMSVEDADAVFSRWWWHALISSTGCREISSIDAFCESCVNICTFRKWLPYVRFDVVLCVGSAHSVWKQPSLKRRVELRSCRRCVDMNETTHADHYDALYEQ